MRTRRINNYKVNKKVLIATVDIGKRSHHGYWRSYTGADCRSFEFSNSREGFDCFWRTIREAQTQQKAASIIVGFESTGAYGEPLVHYLYSKPGTVGTDQSYAHQARQGAGGQFAEEDRSKGPAGDRRHYTAWAYVESYCAERSCLWLTGGIPVESIELVAGWRKSIKEFYR